jgi:hypothetical protein
MTADEMARARVAATLVAIEAAQTNLDEAAQALSAVRGFLPQYERLAKIYRAVRLIWHAVDQRRRTLGERIKLDHEDPTAYELEHWGKVITRAP